MQEDDFTESQHGRVGRDLCGSPSPTPCPSRVTQSRLHSTMSRQVWNISREGDSAFMVSPPVLEDVVQQESGGFAHEL